MMLPVFRRGVETVLLRDIDRLPAAGRCRSTIGRAFAIFEMWPGVRL